MTIAILDQEEKKIEKIKKITEKRPYVVIKLRPYLRDWVVNEYGLDNDEPVLATQGNKLFPFLSTYLTKVPSKHKDHLPDREHLRIYLPYNEVIRVRNLLFINKDHYPEIQSFFYGRFYCKFILFMNDRHIKQKLNIKPCINDFCRLNNINFDKVNYDSLKRIYHRYRNDGDNEEDMKQ
jgi:hypothetical protein